MMKFIKMMLTLLVLILSSYQNAEACYAKVQLKLSNLKLKTLSQIREKLRVTSYDYDDSQFPLIEDELRNTLEAIKKMKSEVLYFEKSPRRLYCEFSGRQFTLERSTQHFPRRGSIRRYSFQHKDSEAHIFMAFGSPHPDLRGSREISLCMSRTNLFVCTDLALVDYEIIELFE